MDQSVNESQCGQHHMTFSTVDSHLPTYLVLDSKTFIILQNSTTHTRTAILGLDMRLTKIVKMAMRLNAKFLVLLSRCNCLHNIAARTFAHIFDRKVHLYQRSRGVSGQIMSLLDMVTKNDAHWDMYRRVF
jgi:hypothetical protein